MTCIRQVMTAGHKFYFSENRHHFGETPLSSIESNALYGETERYVHVVEYSTSII